jgi:hypothetical protein
MGLLVLSLFGRDKRLDYRRGIWYDYKVSGESDYTETPSVKVKYQRLGQFNARDWLGWIVSEYAKVKVNRVSTLPKGEVSKIGFNIFRVY